MIVDWKLLRGNEKYIINDTTQADADILPKGRDGLYEIYTNIVVNFIEQMIAAGEEYVNYSDHSWYGRTDYAGITAQLNTTNEDYSIADDVTVNDILVTTGVAYGYGGNDNTIEFTSKLNNQGTVTSWKDYDVPKVGLYYDEWQYYVDYDSSHITTPGGLDGAEFNPDDWIGIDCRGFVQRISKYPKYSNGHTMITDVIMLDIGEDINNGISCSDYKWVYGTFMNNFTDVGQWDRYANTYRISSTDSKWLHRGDVITSSGHVVAVYEEPADDYSIDFDIIQASGSWYTSFENPNIFARKTIVLPYYEWTLDKLEKRNEINRYGRFVLWYDI